MVASSIPSTGSSFVVTTAFVSQLSLTQKNKIGTHSSPAWPTTLKVQCEKNKRCVSRQVAAYRMSLCCFLTTAPWQIYFSRYLQN